MTAENHIVDHLEDMLLVEGDTGLVRPLVEGDTGLVWPLEEGIGLIDSIATELH